MPIAARIPILKFGTGSPLATARTVSYTMERFTDYFSQNRPDAVLVLGDRYEIFAAGAAAALLEIPLAHISGGDVTAGAADDWFRHCLTKMASLHFPSCEVYARRLIRMGRTRPRWRMWAAWGTRTCAACRFCPARRWPKASASGWSARMRW